MSNKIRKELEYTMQRLNSINGDIAATLNDIKNVCEKNLEFKDKGTVPFIYHIDMIEAYSRRLESLKADYFKAKETLAMLEYFLRD